MISPGFLTERDVEDFRGHFSRYPYCHLVRSGVSHLDENARLLSEEEIAGVIKGFMDSSYPIVCFAGSKSRERFFDYHSALRIDSSRNEALLYEFLVQEPRQEAIFRGLNMASFVLATRGIQRIRVPFHLEEGWSWNDDELLIEAVDDHQSILSRR